MAEWSIASDCKSDGLRPTQVRILPGAQNKNLCFEQGFLFCCVDDRIRTGVGSGEENPLPRRKAAERRKTVGFREVQFLPGAQNNRGKYTFCMFGVNMSYCLWNFVHLSRLRG